MTQTDQEDGFSSRAGGKGDGMSYYVTGSGGTEVEIEGIDALIAKLKELELLPQPIVTHAAKLGGNIALKAAKDLLQPVNEAFLGRNGSSADWGQYPGGTLKGLLKLTRERSKKGKCVYRINTTWYAHFKDLGFTTRDGRKIEGSHFLKYSLTQHYEEIVQAIITDMSNGIDKVVSS